MEPPQATEASDPAKQDSSDDGPPSVIIDAELNLTEEEKARLIFHSYANVLNVLIGLYCNNFPASFDIFFFQMLLGNVESPQT